MAKKRTTKTATFTVGNILMTSAWTVVVDPNNGIPKYSKKPSTGYKQVNFSYSIPSGSKIKSAVITGRLSYPETGIASCRANGSNFKGSLSVTVPSTNGTLEVWFSFTANGTTKNGGGTFTSSLSISDLKLTITYDAEVEVEEKKGEEEKKDGEFLAPKQNVCIYDQEEKKVYTFDGVIKIQQSLTLKIEEDPSKHKELYTNNARNEPDKVTLDVIMSDVYTGGGNLVFGSITSGDGQKIAAVATASFVSTSGATRSQKAVAVLHALKEARRKLTVVTPQYIYTDMLLASITINQDENYPFGWEGQLTFQELYEETQKKDGTSSRGKDTGAELDIPREAFKDIL